jgi:hypothetical protein
MDPANIRTMYLNIDESNKALIGKKDELEYILNRYHEVINKIKVEEVDDDDKLLITTVKEIFNNGNGNINNLIDTYVNNIMSNSNS